MLRPWRAALVALTFWFPTLTASADACREFYIWEKAKSGPDIAKVWCCFQVRYEIDGKVAEQDVVSVRKMLASLAKVTGLTFNEVATGGDLFILTGPNAYERILEGTEQASEFARFNLAHPRGVLNGTVRTAVLSKSPCVASSLEDDSHTIHSAIVATTADVSACLEKTLRTLSGY